MLVCVYVFVQPCSNCSSISLFTVSFLRNHHAFTQLVPPLPGSSTQLLTVSPQLLASSDVSLRSFSQRSASLAQSCRVSSALSSARAFGPRSSASTPATPHRWSRRSGPSWPSPSFPLWFSDIAVTLGESSIENTAGPLGLPCRQRPPGPHLRLEQASA